MAAFAYSSFQSKSFDICSFFVVNFGCTQIATTKAHNPQQRERKPGIGAKRFAPIASRIHTMEFKTGIKISLVGTGIEAIGIFLDILHHLQIGIKTAEGLLTFNHLIIFIGFLINFAGVLITWSSKKNTGA